MNNLLCAVVLNNLPSSTFIIIRRLKVSIECAVVICSSPNARGLNPSFTKRLMCFCHWGFELLVSAEVTVTVK